MHDTPATEISTLSLHDALPIYSFTIIQNDTALPIQGTFDGLPEGAIIDAGGLGTLFRISYVGGDGNDRSEEHTSELQSHSDLVCRLLLEKKNETLTVAGSGHED